MTRENSFVITFYPANDKEDNKEEWKYVHRKSAVVTFLLRPHRNAGSDHFYELTRARKVGWAGRFVTIFLGIF